MIDPDWFHAEEEREAAILKDVAEAKRLHAERVAKRHPPQYPSVATFVENFYCEECGFPIVHIVVRGQIRKKKYAGEDWWQYCSNKCCKNHEGEGVFQNMASFGYHTKRPEWREINDE